MKNRVFLLALIGMSLSILPGCAKKIWDHPSKNAQDFYRDSARCEAMSYAPGSGQAMQGDTDFARGWNQMAAINAVSAGGRIYDSCMMGEGWYLTTEREPRLDPGKVAEQQVSQRKLKELTASRNKMLAEAEKMSEQINHRIWLDFLIENPAFADDTSKQRKYGDYLFETKYNQLIASDIMTYSEALSHVAEDVYSIYPVTD